jgi:spermidine synthase
MFGMKWTIKFRNDFEMHGHAIHQYVVSKQTQFQYVEIVDTFNYGRVLLLDGVTQSSYADEFIYHESSVHPALCSHPDPKNILIIGGGEGAILREVLKHSSIQHVTMVDIDHELVDLCREYLLESHQGAFDDPRLELVYEDGRSYLLNKSDEYDCIFLALSDPFEGSPATKLFTLEFYKLVKRALHETGILSLQAECGAIKHNEEHCRIIHTLRQIFPSVFPYYTYIPIFATLYAFAICGNSDLTIDKVTSTEIDLILEGRGVHDLHFFDSQTSRGLFAIPPYMKLRLESEKNEVITDSNPLSIKI